MAHSPIRQPPEVQPEELETGDKPGKVGAKETMNYQTRANAYRENSVMGMSREDTVPLMYEHLLVGLKRASKQIQEKDYRRERPPASRRLRESSTSFWQA